MEVITDFRVLMQKAYALGQAKKSGNQELIEKAKLDHDAYRDICLSSHKMNIGCTYGDLE